MIESLNHWIHYKHSLIKIVKKIFIYFNLNWNNNTVALDANAAIWSVEYVLVDAPRIVTQLVNTGVVIPDNVVESKANGGPFVSWSHVTLLAKDVNLNI